MALERVVIFSKVTEAICATATRRFQKLKIDSRKCQVKLNGVDITVFS